MDKFSLYDMLGLVLPGAFFVFVFKLIFNLFEFTPLLSLNNEWEMGLGITACLVIVFGAMLYALNFWLLAKVKFYVRISQMYTRVSDIFLELDVLHNLMIPSFNKKAVEWFSSTVFYTKSDFLILSSGEKELVRKCQDEFYDRMYYELEYNEKIENSRTFQSFYYFFRQMALASIIIICVTLILWVASLLPFFKITTTNLDLGLILLTLAAVLIISVFLAKWYRKRMVLKMYWTYFTHLNQNTK